MIIKVNNSMNLELLKETLDKLGVEYNVFGSSFESFVEEEGNYYKEYYGKFFGVDTLNKLHEEVIDQIMNEEVDIVSNMYHSCAEALLSIYDKDTIGVHVISNNCTINFKEINYDFFEAVSSDNKIYTGGVLVDDKGECYVKIDDLEILLSEIIVN